MYAVELDEVVEHVQVVLKDEVVHVVSMILAGRGGAGVGGGRQQDWGGWGAGNGGAAEWGRGVAGIG